MRPNRIALVVCSLIFFCACQGIVPETVRDLPPGSRILPVNIRLVLSKEDARQLAGTVGRIMPYNLVPPPIARANGSLVPPKLKTFDGLWRSIAITEDTNRFHAQLPLVMGKSGFRIQFQIASGEWIDFCGKIKADLGPAGSDPIDNRILFYERHRWLESSRSCHFFVE